MTFTVKHTIYIDEHEIVESILNGTFNLDDAVDDYISALDDCDYYMIGNEEIDKVKAKVKKMLKKINIDNSAQL